LIEVGFIVGGAVTTGTLDGLRAGNFVGLRDRLNVGTFEGFKVVGTFDGFAVGSRVGRGVGLMVGCFVGVAVGIPIGTDVVCVPRTSLLQADTPTPTLTMA
jgi:hypothetical protein